MTKQSVEAVLYTRYNQSNYRALYGRLGNGTKYTKDYIQIPRTVSEKLGPLLNSSSKEVEVEYVWPGGEQHGHFSWSTDRYHLKWETNNPPKPWRLGDIAKDPVVSLPGNTSERNEALADAQFFRIDELGWEPWLLAVKLSGEGNRLHLRVYFENPPDRFKHRAVALLPQKLQVAMASLSGTDTGICDWRGDLIAPLPQVRAPKLVEEIQEALARDPNVLLVGPPGTGKSIALEDLRNLYTSHVASGAVMFDPDLWENNWSIHGGPESRSHALVFHPSYSYENFVAGLFPKSSANSGVELEAQPGPLLCLSHWVGDLNRSALLILDEFNRGPAAAIFGDTLSLLDKDKRSSMSRPGAHIQRPYPAQNMPVPASYRRNQTGQSEHIDAEIRLPAGVHIVAAMNSTDRSVAPLDAAMRRRFTIIRVRPDYAVLAEHLLQDPERAQNPLPGVLDIEQWQPDDVSALAVQLLQALNERIEFCLGEDFLLGHALVWGIGGSTAVQRLTQLSHAIDSKVIPTLRMTFIAQDEALAAVLGISDDVQIERGGAVPAGRAAYWLTAPVALASFASKRLVVQPIHEMSPANQLAALVAIAAH